MDSFLIGRPKIRDVRCLSESVEQAGGKGFDRPEHAPRRSADRLQRRLVLDHHEPTALREHWVPPEFVDAGTGEVSLKIDTGGPQIVVGDGCTFQRNRRSDTCLLTVPRGRLPGEKLSALGCGREVVFFHR